MMQSNWDFYRHLFTLIRTYVLLIFNRIFFIQQTFTKNQRETYNHQVRTNLPGDKVNVNIYIYIYIYIENFVFIKTGT